MKREKSRENNEIEKEKGDKKVEKIGEGKVRK